MSGTAGSSCEGTVDQDQHPETSSPDWSEEEQANLSKALALYPAEKYPTSLERCILVAAQIPTRSAREVALRLTWLSAQQTPRRPGQDLKRRSSVPSALLTRAASFPTAAARSGLRSPTRTSLSRQVSSRAPARPQQQQQPNSAPLPTAPLVSANSSSATAHHQQLQFPTDIPPPGPVPLLPTLSASCFYESPSPPSTSTSCEDAANPSADHGPGTSGPNTSGSAEPRLETCHQQSRHQAAAPQQQVQAVAAHQHKLPQQGLQQPSSPLVAAVQSLMEQNYVILNTFKSNMQQCKVVENTELLVRYRDNVMACLNHMNTMGGTIANMPPLLVQPNLELANKFLPMKLGMPMGHMPPMGMPPGMPPFPYNPAMGPPPGMPLMFPPMGAPPGMMGLHDGAATSARHDATWHATIHHGHATSANACHATARRSPGRSWPGSPPSAHACHGPARRTSDGCGSGGAARHAAGCCAGCGTDSSSGDSAGAAAAGRTCHEDGASILGDSACHGWGFLLAES